MADIYDESKKLTEAALGDLAILAGDEAGNGSSWQDVAGTAAVNLRALADFLDTVRKGESHWRGCPLTGPVVFASPAEALEVHHG
jgi:hypothetical protein